MKKTLLIISLLFLGACETIEVPELSAVNKSEGIVEFSYQHHVVEKASVDWDNVLVRAQILCKDMGYKTAFPLDAHEDMYAPQVETFYVTAKYKCTNSSAALQNYKEEQVR